MQSGSTPQTDDYFKDIQAPTVDQLSYKLQELVQQGVLTPEQAQAQLVQSSEMNNVTTDPKLHEAQMAALSGLQNISDSGGMTDADRANLNKIKTDEDSAARGKREAIIQGAQSRGLGGSGLELMSQMQNQQDSATRNSQRDMDVAGDAQARALQALIQGGTTAGNIQAQDFSQQAQKASANDAIAKFNAQNTQAVNMANTTANNQAQEANLANKQGIANANVATANQQAAQKAQIAQQQYDNAIKKASGQTGVAQTNAANAGKDSQSEANATNSLIGAGLGAGTSIYGSYAKGKKEGGIIDGPPADFDNQMTPTQSGEFVVRKEDVPEFLEKAHTDEDGNFDAAAFMDSITGHKYGYSKKGK